MIIDFTEIPPSNRGGQHQDLFEQFACTFLETKGFEIVRRPDRGPDGKKDLIVKEKRNGLVGNSEILWLVSCKHYAYSNKSVNDKDELDIYDRTKKFNCDGFIGFYSTIAASSLSDKLHQLKINYKPFEYIIYDNSRIENELLTSNHASLIIASYFPASNQKYLELNLQRQSNYATNNSNPKIELSVIKTALIILEIDKIEEQFETKNWFDRLDILNQLFRYRKHSNEEIACAIFDFAYSVSLSTRISRDSKISSILKSLVYSYFPSSDDYSSQQFLDNAKSCINIGYNIVYDAFIWINNFEIAIDGLLIWKFIYKFSTDKGVNTLAKEIELRYEDLNNTLSRPERNDLENAKRIVNVFEMDLNRNSMDYPDLPDDLYKLILDSK